MKGSMTPGLTSSSTRSSRFLSILKEKRPRESGELEIEVSTRLDEGLEE